MPTKRTTPPHCHHNSLKGQLNKLVLAVKPPKKKTLRATLKAMHIEIRLSDARARLMAFYYFDSKTGTIKKHGYGHGTS